MTGNTCNSMELLVQHIQKGYHSTSRVSVRKIYIDEDPAKEQAIPCPRCLDRNKQNMVRYLFLNLNEAIYKCEANDCMYPFRNFKFKNFEESTVYHYQRQSPDISFGNNFSSECYSYENSMDNVAAIDFSLDFLAGNNGGTELQQQSPTPAEPTSSQCLPAASDYANLSTSFDTGFIDDMLQDLFPSTVNPSLKVNDILDQKIDPIVPIQAAPACTEDVIVALPCNAVEQSTKLIGRKLEKCLKVFEKPANISEEEVFKKPKSPESSSLVVEHITPTKLRIKNIGGSMTKTISNTTVAKGSKHKKSKTAVLPIGLPSHSGSLALKQARALVKNKKIKPLEFVSTLNTLVQRKNVEEPIVECQPTVKKSPNCAKVQKMLNFIQRSMKTSEGKSCPLSPAGSLSDNDESSRNYDGNLDPPDRWLGSFASCNT
uniref:Uncharacterized protein n=2 Tax=Anopheles gambiae TaxID=7165 RepID=A0A1S4H3Q7_ANOGA